MRILGIIPARFASTRFPAKPLALIEGKSMIRRVYEQVKKSASLRDVVVATDDDRIADHVLQFGGSICMTREDHVSGTDRCYEALIKQNGQFDFVINIQGDEPFIQPEQIELLAGVLDAGTEIATLVKAIEDQKSLFNPNTVKVVISNRSEALYFSRTAIPYLRNVPEDQWLNHFRYYKHLGMYAYRTDVLKEITSLPVARLEKAESLEQLRWIENGFRIRVAETETETIGIDTPEDLDRAVLHLRNQS